MRKYTNEAVIHLKIDDFAGFAKKEYKKQCVGNNNWTLGVYPHTDETKNEKYLGVYLKCNEELYSYLWSCTASVRVSLINSDDKDNNAFSMDYVKHFDRRDDKIEIPLFKKWDDIVVRNKAIIEFSIEVHISKGIRKFILETLEKPDKDLTDAVLLVEGKKVYVGKQILAMHSKYLELFLSDLEESTETELPIKDVVHSEFTDLLNFIYPSHREIDEDNLNYILKLADRFKIWFIIEQIEDFLIKTKEIDLVDKLIYAETYKLPKLQDSCFKQFHKSGDVFKVNDQLRYRELGNIKLCLFFNEVTDLLKKEMKVI